ncbi:Probable galacturonosyltransferase 7 isoform 2 [Zea mays]|uniref:Hexosyltransferase n=1 Tax=Zea mays TaxID=4577 RepID=A0A1D6PB77_MAIZE|nr:Probable galacturonosyltransferase 7 isoform 2 [Zea mays]AQL06908.1 Transferase [Zea mays]AQL06911.1 Transferase [Zea mays]|eukprot:XP_008658718.1 transferase, transferring glycosyl groups isoform X1 [Zea mays]
MKATAPPAKRRRGPRLAVLALVFCSLLVPIAFLFNRFPAVYVTDERPQQEIDLPSFDRVAFESGGSVNEDVFKKTSGSSSVSHHVLPPPKIELVLPPPKVEPKPEVKPVPVSVPVHHNKKINVDKIRPPRVQSADEVEKAKACQLEFGSYCLWSIEHKEVMIDTIVKRLKDQLFVARSYYPSIAKLKGKETLTRELKQNIQEHERVLSESIVDADLPSFIKTKVERMDQSIARAKSCTVDCNNVDRKLRQILHMTEDEAHFHMKQSAYLYNLGVHTMPKSHHCLNMRLTVEYFKSMPLDPNDSSAHTFNIPDNRHYVILSKNVLAASVVINSTVSSSEDTENIVFHVLTDAQNFYAMKHWFARNSYRESAVNVINYEQIIFENFPEFGTQQLYLPEEFRVFISSLERPTEKSRMEYLSVFSHSHFFLAEIFKDLKKVIVLDDDLVVQHDLSFLWNLDMGDKVHGAVRFCGLKLGQLRNLLGRTMYDQQSCAWMSGVNVIDLEKWRDHNVTENYLQLLRKFGNNGDEASLRSSALPISLLLFQHLLYPLDERLTLSGLGYDYGIKEKLVQSSASLHYNGNMKPWLELGIPDYRKYWKRFLTRDERFMDECNVSP